MQYVISCAGRTAFGIGLLFSLLFAASCSEYQVQGTTNLKAHEFAQSLSEHPGQLLDVRTPDEYSSGHLEGSRLINFYDNDFLAQCESLNKEETVYIYCKSGGRSSKAADQLVQAGFKSVINLEGGITAWSEAGLPVSNL